MRNANLRNRCQMTQVCAKGTNWIPASAGMTRGKRRDDKGTLEKNIAGTDMFQRVCLGNDLEFNSHKFGCELGKKKAFVLTCVIRLYAPNDPLKDIRSGGNSPPEEGRATKWRGGCTRTDVRFNPLHPLSLRYSEVPLPNGAELRLPNDTSLCQRHKLDTALRRYDEGNLRRDDEREKSKKRKGKHDKEQIFLYICDVCLFGGGAGGCGRRAERQ